MGEDFGETRAVEMLREMSSLQTASTTDLQETVRRLTAQTEELRTIIGKVVSEVLNRSRGEIIGGLSKKRETAKAINDLLDGLGLRLSTKTGREAVLIAVPNSDEHDTSGNGRFRMRSVGTNPEWQSSVKFPKIEIMLRDMAKKGHGRQF